MWSLKSIAGKMCRFGYSVSVTRLAAVLLAGSLAVTVQTAPAEASHKWVGPAIVGIIIGAAIAHNHGKYHHKHYRKYPRFDGHYRHGKRYRKRYQTFGDVPRDFPHAHVRSFSRW